MSRSKLDALTDRAKSLGRRGPGVDARARAAACSSRPSRSSSPRPNSSASSTRWARDAGDLMLIVAGERPMVRHVLGQLRLDLGRPPVSEGACSSCGSSTSRCSKALDDDGPADPRAPPVHDAASRRPRSARSPIRCRCGRRRTTSCSTVGSSARARVRIHRPDVQQRDLHVARHRTRRGAGAVRIPARRVPLRRAAARGLRGRHRPLRRDPRGRGEHPRGDRVPEDAVGRRPAHERARPTIDPRQLQELGLRKLDPKN